jgi:SAM-dependent methyltransferase
MSLVPKRYSAMPGREQGKLSAVYQAAKVFHDHAAEYDNWFASSLVYEIELAALRSLKSIILPPEIEIGVGPGRFARDLGIAFGLDPAWAPLRLARQRGITCCQGLGEELPVKDGSCGAVYLLFTLCFVLQPQKLISECCRVLKDNGHFIIGMIPAESKWGEYLAAKKKAAHIFYKHANFYTVETVRRWLAESNMDIIEFRSTLYQAPEGVEQIEAPQESLDEKAGFVVIAARRG